MLCTNSASECRSIAHLAKTVLLMLGLLLTRPNGWGQEKKSPASSADEVLVQKLRNWEEQLVKIRQAMFDDCDEAIKKADANIERITKERDEARKAGRRDQAKQLTQVLRKAEGEREALHRLRGQIEKQIDVGSRERGRRRLPQQARLGLQLAAVEPVVVSQLALSDAQGLTIQKVRDGSPAARAGLLADDILLEIEGKPVPSQVHGFRQLVAELPSEKPWSVVVIRGGRKIILTLPAQEPRKGR